MGNMTTLQILQGVHDWVLDKIDEETANFITKTVNDLVNYYTKSETYTKAEVQQIVDAIKQFTYEVVQVLPTASASTMNKIYLVPAPKSEDKNVKEEYITIQDGSTYSWEMLGTTSIDLSNYYTKGQTDSAISSALSSALASYTTTADLTTLLAQKQDVIQDLADIRSGASAGSTAVQPSTLNNAVKNVVAESGVYDVSANNDNTKFESLSALLSSANLNTLIPTDIRKGGMSIKFVLSSDNNYVQFRYMSSSTSVADFTNVANWQGVDDEPTEGSDNLVKSGGVYTELEKKANIDGYYETMGVGTADNLTGQTERTNDAMYRKTGGSEEVASGTATISNIKGNTIAWNQLMENGDFEDTDVSKIKGVGIVGVKIANNVLSFTTNQNVRGIYIDTSLIVGHKYLVYVATKQNNTMGIYAAPRTIGGYTSLAFYNTSSLFEYHSVLYTCTDSNDKIFVAGRLKNTKVWVKNLQLFDLTLIYGGGNEPTTVSQFEADYFKWFGKPLTYEAYDAGSLRPVLMNSIKTVGFNQCPSNGLVRAIIGSQYQITGTYNSIWESDEEEVSFVSYTYGETTEIGLMYSNGNGRYMCNYTIAAYSNTSTYGVGQFVIYDGSIYKCNTAISTAEEWDAAKWDLIADVSAMVTEGIFVPMDITPDSNGIFTPTKFYVHVEGGNNTDTCVHLVGNGERNGEYEQYQENSVSIPITTLAGKLNGEGESVVVFPEGMKSAGTVYDEIYTVGDKTYAVKRIGSVDLGTLSWTGQYSQTSASGKCFTISFNLMKTQDSAHPNLRMSIYPSYKGPSLDWKSVPPFTLYSVFNYLVLSDNVSTTVTQFKAVMQGVPLYYELKTPQVYELDTFDLPIRYQVDNNGTEEQIQKSGVQGLAAILTCIYGVDAVKILDKLPQNYISEKSMDNFLAQLNNVTGGTWTKTWNDNTGEWDFSFTPNAQTNDTNIEETI